MMTSSSRKSPGVMIWAMLATRLRCVSITPFDRPVVPDEYGRATTASPETATCSASGSPYHSSSESTPSADPMTAVAVMAVRSAAAAATSSVAGTVTSSDAPASTSWWWTSRSV